MMVVTPLSHASSPAHASDVITVFQGLGRPVSLQNWTALNANLLPGGNLGPGAASCEYSNGNMADGYVLLNDNTTVGTKPTNGYSYPKFRTAGGRYVSMRHGLWEAASYQPNRLVLINMPVLKKHGMAATTAAWKNLIGFLTCEGSDGSRYASWGMMHTYFWGFDDASNVYGLIGRHISLVRTPDLNLVDAVWVANENNYASSSAVRTKINASAGPPIRADV